MSTRGGGRGRGVGRGRSRGGGALESRRPGEQPKGTPSEAQQQVGRGRGRAAAQIQQKPPSPTSEVTPQMQKMSLDGKGGGAVAGARTDPTKGDRPPRREIQISEPHTRPEHITDKRGAAGNEVDLVTNYVILKNRPGKAIYQYNVSYSPPVDSKSLRIALLRDHEESLIGKIRAFDGMILYLPHRLPNDTTEVVSKTKSDDTIKLTIKLTNELSANSPVCLQLFNVLFRRILAKLEMKQIGRHYYNPKASSTIPQHKLEVWPGFVTSILQYEQNVMLCADISHKILRTDTVLDVFFELQNEPKFHDAATRALVGEIVLTRYNNRTYRIDDINWDMTPMSTFTSSTGEEISFSHYYKKAYDIEIEDKKQPLLVSRPRKKDEMAARRAGKDPASIGPVLLVPELCTRTGLSEEARSDFRVMKDVAIYTRQGPAQRVDTLSRFVNQLNTNREVQDILSGWNLEFDRSLLKFKGRTLTTETIFQKDAKFSYKPLEADWSRDMRGKHLINSISLREYNIIFSARDVGLAQDFIQSLKRVGPPMGIMVSDPRVNETRDNRTDSFLRTLSGSISPNTQLVIVILPNNRKDLYDAVKKLCCVDSPVPSQCIVARTLSKKQNLMSVTTKIALQLNCKLGGELWALEIPLKNLMVVGVDTYHDSASKGRSVGGFIASTNSSLTRYYSQTMFQHTGQELADNLKTCMAGALRKYHEKNNALPDRIVVYRDGVGDGQLPMVVEHEVPQMLSAFKDVNADYKPRFAIVVVKKRINTRLFGIGREQLVNPLPGTVVDTEVTKPEWYDFFLVSQSVRQGTVSPTHFNVVHDTTGLKPDHMQRLTYKLTHLYYNWPGTVRVPAPCQYAHKLAFLVGQSIHKEPSRDIADRLYFL